MTATDRLNAMQQRCDAATEGPWDVYRYEHGGGRIVVEGDPGGRHRALIADVYHAGDREFLLGARTDIPATIAALRAVLKVHAPAWESDYGHYCQECGTPLTDDAPDCPTVRAITEALT